MKSVKHKQNSDKKNIIKKNKVLQKIRRTAELSTAIETKQELVYVSKHTFSESKLHQKLKATIASKGYANPTEVQEKSLEPLLNKNDLVGIAATGTGKTAAFLIPIIHQMLLSKEKTALVIVPVRELAQQVKEEFMSLTKKMGLSASCFVGGTNINKDIAIARNKHRFMVATPGRLGDLIDRKAIELEEVSILVLDEFDRMLDMGFIRDVRKISSIMSKREQTILFSATKESSQENLINELVDSPVYLNVSSGLNSSENVEQNMVEVLASENKFDILLKLLNKDTFKKGILFLETKRGADRIHKKLQNSGLISGTIHGGKSQSYRNRAIRLFKSGEIKILVATDIAARGIHVDNVSHVINYQLPMTMDSYIHRIGRTGRSGKLGKAYTFIN